MQKELSQEEQIELQQGRDLLAMTASAGWEVVKGWLETAAYHSWVDPRGTDKEDYLWQELNAYHAANNAKEILENIEKIVSRSQALAKKSRGETRIKSMGIGR